MSRPAFRYQYRRTTECPTCKAAAGYPCIRLNPTRDALDDYGQHVSPHAARLRAEADLLATTVANAVYDPAVTSSDRHPL